MMPEPSQNADPAVTAEKAESSQTADTIDFASAGSSNICEKSADPVARYVTALICTDKLPEPLPENAAQGNVAQV